jgi:hypothetical protein
MRPLPPTESWPTKPARMLVAVAVFADAGAPVGIRWSPTGYHPRGTVLRADWHSPVPSVIGADVCRAQRCLTVYPVPRQLAGQIRVLFAEQVLPAAVSWLQAGDQHREGWQMLAHAQWWTVDADGTIHQQGHSGQRPRHFNEWTPDH